MGLRQKFILLAAVAGLIVAIVSGVSYYIAYTDLKESVEHEIQSSVETESQALETWLQAKVSLAQSAANVMSAVDSNSNLARQNLLLSAGVHDREILTMAVGNEDGFIMTYADGDITKIVDPRTRDWYRKAKSSGATIFTEAYQDTITGKQVISIAVPYKNSVGNFRGVICEDVLLDVLNERAKNIHYHGEGYGYIVQSDGKILAASNPAETAETADKSSVIGNNFSTIKSGGKGYFINDEQVFGYTTLEDTGWIILVSAPESDVFAEVHDMQMKYSALAIFGIIIILLMMFVCINFSSQLINSITILQTHAQDMSKGILSNKNILVESEDELGLLSGAFNSMSNNIRELIKKSSKTAEQVAASAEELTAGAEQSAQSAINSAEAVQSLVVGMNEQAKTCDELKKFSEDIFNKIEDVTEQMAHVMVETIRTQENARGGDNLMKDAVDKMTSIENKVALAADVVKKLGENSKQIDEIIDAIARIADQTNLLALNAAIEAARAGEHGKGFAIVAEEVRKLASESQESAEKIRVLIQHIQENTEAAVNAMEGGNSEVRAGTAAVSEVGSQFNKILEMLTSSKEKIDYMAPKVAEVSRNAETILNSVSVLDEIAQQTSYNTNLISKTAEEQSATTEEIAAASQILSNMAIELKEETSKFSI